MASLFGTINKKKTIIERHKEIVKSHFKLLLVVFFLEGLILTLQMIDPYFYKVFIDNVLIGKDWNSFIVVCFGKIGVCIFFVLFCTINNHVKFTFFNGLIYHIKKEILSNFLHMPANKQEEYLAGDMEEIINQDIAMFETFWKDQIINYLIDVVYIVSLFFLMIRINFKMTLILCLFIPVPYIVSGILGRFNYGRQLKRRKFYGLYENLVYESLQAWKEVKALALEKRFLMKFVDLRHKIARFDIISGYCEVAQESVDFFSKIASTKIFIYFIGGLIIFDGGMTVGELQAELDRLGVPRSFYAINGHLSSDTHILEWVHTYWQYFYFDEKGNANDCRKFEQEADACEYLLQKLKTEMKYCRPPKEKKGP